MARTCPPGEDPVPDSGQADSSCSGSGCSGSSHGGSGRSRLALLLLFGLSGAVALVYEVVWTRALLLLLGSTAAASALVVALFVAGLGLGARWGGRRLVRAAPLRFYAWCELGAAAWAALALPLLALLEGPYTSIAQAGPAVAWALRLGFAALIVVPSAFLLGATLPALVSRWTQAKGTAAAGTAWLYGVNALGAAIGALLPAWWTLERYGVKGTLYGAVAAGLLIGVVAWIASRGESVAKPSADTALRAARGMWPLAIFAGAMGLAIEIVGFRILVFFLEGFTVTFAAMLAVFVVGLAIGSLTMGPLAARVANPRRALGIIFALEGVLLLVVWYLLVPSFEPWMADIKRGWFEGATTPIDVAYALKGASLVGAAVLLLIPAIVLGPTFTLCVRAAEQSGCAPNEAVGATYLANSMGSLLGPILFTFAIIPLFGVPFAWLLLGVLALTCGLWHVGMPLSWRSVIPLATAFAMTWVLPAHDADALVRHSTVLRGRTTRTLVDVRTDAGTTASVIATNDGERLLYTDDFPAAAVGRHYRYMRMLGLLPCVLANEPRNTMVIAFGTGTTAGAVARVPGVESIKVVEVSSAVLELAPHFASVNRGVLEDPRTTVIHDDGRNALRLHAANLDVITLEPLMPYSPAGLPFYTREFYELARDRLREGGVVCQWVPVHAMPAELYAAFLRTFFEVFPEGSLWFFEQSTALIGRKGSASPTAAQVASRMRALHGDLSDAGVGTANSFSAAYLADGATVLSAPVPSRSERLDATRVIRDLDPYPEFFPTPRARLSTPYLAHTLEYLATLVSPAVPTQAPWWPADQGEPLRIVARQAMAARWQDAVAETLSLQIRARPPGHPDLPMLLEQRRNAFTRAASGYSDVRAALPDDPVMAWRHVRVLRRHAVASAMQVLGRSRATRDQAEKRRQSLLAARLMMAALPPALKDEDPAATERANAVHVLVAALLQLGRCGQAREEVHAALHDGTPGVADLEQEINRLSNEPRQSLRPAWIFRHAATCTNDDVNRASADIKAIGAALAAGQLSARQLRAQLKAMGKRLEREVLSRDFHNPNAAFWNEPLSKVSSELQVIVAVFRDRLERTNEYLRPMFKSRALQALAVTEAARWKTLPRYMDAIPALLTSDDDTVRTAVAAAAATWTARPIQRLVVDLLGDDHEAVRQAAWTALLPHAKELLSRYDPRSGPVSIDLRDTLRTHFTP